MNTLSPRELDLLADRIADAVAARLGARPTMIDSVSLARELSLSPTTIERLAKRGAIPSVTAGRRRLYDPAAVRAVLEVANEKGGDRRC